MKTELQVEKARQIITENDSPDIGFNTSINPHRGCEHGWVYAPVTHTGGALPSREVVQASFSSSSASSATAE